MFWGLAVNGESGLSSVIEILREELDATMGMCGSTEIASINDEDISLFSPLLSAFPNHAYNVY